jgi:hypothetical protein
MQTLKFKAELLPAVKAGKACYFVVPFSIQEVWGSKAAVKVKANVDKLFHRGLIVPDGKGNHFMGLKTALMAELGKSAGDVVDVTLEVDTEERIVEIPPALKKLLAKNLKEKKIFDKLSYTRRKEYALWISSAKKKETLHRRLEKIIVMLREKINN